MSYACKLTTPFENDSEGWKICNKIDEHSFNLDKTYGFVTYDRQIVKVDKKVMKKISKAIFKSFRQKNRF